MPKKPILCLDFDGVLHGYQSGWQGAAIIPDPPVPGAVEFLHRAVERFQVAIYSSRSGQPGGIDAMRGWLTMYVMLAVEDHREAKHVLSLIQWPTEKPAAIVTIDDRAITFTGAWPTMDEIAGFKPWNKRTPQDKEAAELFQSERISAALATYDYVLGDADPNEPDHEERVFEAMRAAIEQADHIARTGALPTPTQGDHDV